MTRWKPPQKAKRDLNEPDIIAELLAHGLSVEPTDKPADLVVGHAGRTYLVEVKNGPKAPLTKYQKQFIPKWTGHYIILCSVDEATAFAWEVKRGTV